MNEIDHFNFFILYSGDVTADVDHLHVKRIYLVGFFYIVIENTKFSKPNFKSKFFLPYDYMSIFL
jgi:hypothetical protein